MKYIFFFLLLSFYSQGQSEEYKALLEKYYSDFPTISISNANAKLGNSTVYFLDTRELNEYRVSHLKGARYVGFLNFDIETIKDIPKSSEIVVYCSIGARSQHVGELLVKAGYKNVKNLYGGLFNWVNFAYPVVNSQGFNTQLIHGYSLEWGKWIKNGQVVYD